MKPRSTGVVTTIALLVAAAILCGCAKRPVTATASAHPPPAAAAPASPVAPPPRPAAAPMPIASAPPGTVRPSPGGFVATADLLDIHFDFDKYAVRPDDGKILDANATWLKAHTNLLLPTSLSNDYEF